MEADLTAQHVYMIKEGTVVWDAPCVTGNVSKNYTTPPGLYRLTYKQRDRVLRGQKQADGKYEYETPVSYWMPFNGGIGFHDETESSKFVDYLPDAWKPWLCEPAAAEGSSTL